MIKKFFDSFTSQKETVLNIILEKVGKGRKLSNKEKNFIDNYHLSNDSDVQDFMYLDRTSTANRVKILLDNSKKVICDLEDKNGKIGIKIVDIDNQFTSDICILLLDKGLKVELKDNFLYNILYNIKRDEYSLQTQDEYYEKISLYPEEI